MKRLTIVFTALLLTACGAPSTDWHPNFMHWSNPNSKYAQVNNGIMANATDGAIDDATVGEAEESGTSQQMNLLEEVQPDEAQAEEGQMEEFQQNDGGGE